MKRTIGNFLTQTDKDFPVDAELFASIQENESMLAIIGNLAGNKAILYGCGASSNGAYRNSGYVFIRTKDYPVGEVLFFEGGATQSGMYIKKESIAVESQGKEYPSAYTVRHLAPGVGDENYSWDDFKDLTTIQDLINKNAEQDKQIELLQPTPVGVVQMWAGKVTADAIPENYMLCDGTKLVASEYPDLYEAIGRLHTVSTVPTGYFCLPDLRSRFVVGYNGSETDYNAIAKTGGEKKHALTVSEMPSHQHYFKDYYYPEAYSTGGYSGNEKQDRVLQGSGDSDKDNYYLYYKNHYTDSSGSGFSHENRPPYYTLAYIIRVK